MKIRALFLTLATVVSAWGQLQQTAPAESGFGAGSFNPVSLASGFFERGNFVNYYAFANAVYDSYAPRVNLGGETVNNGAFGYDVGGGVSAYHAWRRSSLSLGYSGAYRHYSSSFFGSGTDQSLNLSFTRQFTRRWRLAAGVSAGTTLFGTGYLNTLANTNGNIQLNPFSSNTRYGSGYVSVAYQQSRRLSYIVTGGIFLQRFSYTGGIGSTGGNGDIGVVYRITARTNIAGDYNHSYFVYQQGVGNTTLDGANFSLSHRFGKNWNVTGSGGITHSNINGIFFQQVFLDSTRKPSPTGLGTSIGFLRIPYQISANSPAFQGTLTRYMRRSQLSVSGGQNVVSGNGYFLTSTNQSFNGVYSRNYQRFNISLGGYWSRLGSVSNSNNSDNSGNSSNSGSSYGYNTSGFSANYSYVVLRHVSANARYEFVRYGNVGAFSSVADNRFGFGISFSSKSVPLTLY